jgi:pimeloyl-ACP methyl ester carboxylesterase
MFAESVEVVGLTRWESFAAALECGIEAERRFRAWTPGRNNAAASGPVGWLEAGSGPGVVLVNGWTLSGLVWPADFVDSVAVARRVVRVDNRGTGQRRSDRSLFTIADLAGDVRDVIEAAALGSPTVVGFSLGGMIAAELALRWPDHVGGLVLVSARPPSPARVGGRPGILGRALTPPTTDRPLADQFRERWARVVAPGFADRHPERLAEMASAALAPVTPRRTVLAQARAVGAWRGAHRLGNLAVPCTVVHGALDPLSPAENSRRLAALIPGARYVELDGVGHLVPQEAPQRLAELVTAASHTTTKEHR